MGRALPLGVAALAVAACFPAPPRPSVACEASGHPCADVAWSEAEQACVETPRAAGAPCDDGLVCTVDDACTELLVCRGRARLCEDGDPCTANACDPTSGCVATVVADVGCAPEPCDQAALADDPCRVAVWDAVTGACAPTPVAAGTACASDDPCAADATCDGLGACLAAETVTCDGGSGCHQRACHTAGGVVGCAGVGGCPCADDADCRLADLGCVRAACLAGTCGLLPVDGSDLDCDGDGTADFCFAGICDGG